LADDHKTVLLYNEMIMIGIFVSCTSCHGKTATLSYPFYYNDITGQV